MAYSPDKIITEALSRQDLVEGLRQLGVREGMTLEVHSSMSRFGYVIGGSQTVVDALMDAVGYNGTLVMPLQASSNTEPSYWENPPLERQLWQKARDGIPAYDPDATEFNWMGAVVNNLNRRHGAYRSSHPSCGFVTFGRYGKLIAHTQDLDFGLSENSPLGTMYGLPNTYILLLGVDYDNCTAMHLSEYRSNTRDIILQGGAMEENGYRKWVRYLDLDYDSDEFPDIGQQMEKKGLVQTGKIGEAVCHFMKFADTVDFATEYLKKKHA